MFKNKSGCNTTLTIIGTIFTIITGIIAVFVFITGKTDIPALLAPHPSTVTPSPAPQTPLMTNILLGILLVIGVFLFVYLGEFILILGIFWFISIIGEWLTGKWLLSAKVVRRIAIGTAFLVFIGSIFLAPSLISSLYQH